MEILVRIAVDKYLRRKIVASADKAVQTLFEDNLLHIIKEIDSSYWRNSRYICEPVDSMLKANKIIFDSIYKKYSGDKVLPGHKTFMSLDEFRDLCTSAEFVG